MSRYVLLHDERTLGESCPGFRVTVDWRDGIVAHICGFVSSVGQPFGIRYDLVVRITTRDRP